LSIFCYGECRYDKCHYAECHCVRNSCIGKPDTFFCVVSFELVLVILGLGLRRKGENVFSSKLFSKSAISYFSQIGPKEMSEIENAETTFRETKKFIFCQNFKQLLDEI